MKLIFLASLMLGAAACFSQKVDTAWMVRAVDSLIKVSSEMQKLGDFDNALIAVETAKRLANEKLPENHPKYAKALNASGNLHKNLERFGEAEAEFLEAKKIWEALGGVNPTYLGVLVNLASLYYVLGRFEEAEPLFLKAKSGFEIDLDDRGHRFYLNCLNNLASFYHRTGRLEQAEKMALEVSEMHKRAQTTQTASYANNLTNLASLYLDMGKYEAAEENYLKSKSIQEAIDKEGLGYALVVNNMGVLYHEMKKYEDAERSYLESKVLYEKANATEEPVYALTLNNLGCLNLKMGRFENAEKLHLDAKFLIEKVSGDKSQDYLYNLNNLAIFYAETSRYKEAEPLFFEVSENIKKDLRQAVFYQSGKELFDYVQLFETSLDAWASYVNESKPLAALCYNNALFHKGFLLTAANRTRQLAMSNLKSVGDFEQLTTFRRQLAKENAKPTADRMGVEELRKKANLLEKEIVRNVAGFGENLRQVSWQEVQTKLKPGEAAIEFVRYQLFNPEPTDSVFYAALVLRDNEAPLFVRMFEEREIMPLLQNANGRASESIDSLYANLFQKKLYDLIWKPLETGLNGSKTIYCSAAGELHRINLGAITDPSGQYFGKKFRLILLGSTRQLVVANNPTQAAGIDGLVMGGIRYEPNNTMATLDSDGLQTRGPANPIKVDTILRGGKLEYLPATAFEAVEISKMIKTANMTAQLDTGHYATEEAIKKWGYQGPGRSGSPRILHIATHGFFFPEPKNSFGKSGKQAAFKSSDDPMMRNGLLFAGANRAWTTGVPTENREDGILTASEISQLDLSETEIVVLSACETGLGANKGNEGIYGLQRAFKIAGAKYLVMSLWEVDDRATKELMTDFYRQWLKNGLKIPDAFRAAQEIAHRKNPDRPYLWAGFVLLE